MLGRLHYKERATGKVASYREEDLQRRGVCEGLAEFAFHARLGVEIHFLEGLHGDCNAAIGHEAVYGVVKVLVAWFHGFEVVVVGGEILLVSLVCHSC